MFLRSVTVFFMAVAPATAFVPGVTLGATKVRSLKGLKCRLNSLKYRVVGWVFEIFLNLSLTNSLNLHEFSVHVMNLFLEFIEHGRAGPSY